LALLEVKDLKKYYKDIKAVDGITFSVEKGDLLGLLGPNGAGKSTAISLIASLIAPLSGSITYGGEDILKNPMKIRKVLGLVPQEIAVYPNLSGRDNLAFWGRAYGLQGQELNRRIDEVAGLIGIKDRLKDKVKKYSGGMQRRLNIGVALLHKPEFLIMDEATVGIDPQSRNYILDTVAQLAKNGATIIYTTHYIEEVETLCNKICIMDKGKIIASGSKEELISSIGADYKITIKTDGGADLLLPRLQALPCVKVADGADNIIHLLAKGEEVSGSEILAEIAKNGSKLLSYDVEKPNLESVFLHLTGRALRD
jgi:ABC-2 type transport system ATP-binding protein